MADLDVAGHNPRACLEAVIEAWFDAESDASDTGYSITSHADLPSLARRLWGPIAFHDFWCQVGMVALLQRWARDQEEEWSHDVRMNPTLDGEDLRDPYGNRR